jgi:hypothetical protein
MNREISSTSKAENERVEVERLGAFFDANPDPASRIAAVKRLIDPYLASEAKLGFSATDVMTRIDSLGDVDERADFVHRLYAILGPLKEQLDQHPEILERIQRKQTIEKGGFTSLDEEDFVSYGLGENGWAHLHISPGRTIEKISEPNCYSRDCEN